jgi:hypothetical protein
MPFSQHVRAVAVRSERGWQESKVGGDAVVVGVLIVVEAEVEWIPPAHQRTTCRRAVLEDVKVGQFDTLFHHRVQVWGDLHTHSRGGVRKKERAPCELNIRVVHTMCIAV